MRTALSTIVISLLLASLVACGTEQAQQARNDLLFMSTESGVASVKAAGRSPTFRSDDGVPAGDWSTVVRTERVRNPATTALIGVDPSSGEEVWRQTLSGDLQPKVVSPDGAYVALVPGRQSYAARPQTSTFTVSGRDVVEPTTIRLKGNFEPEAFSTDGKVLFVVQYLPAANPTRYQVRQLDVATGVVGDVYSVDKELQEAMRGTARVQEMSADGKRLYTLYSTRTRHGEHSFIHVLSLDELWAHCIDLPHGFAMSGDAKTALGLTADGKRLYVADTSDGGIVEVDTARLRVVREAEVEQLAGSRGATVAVDEAKDSIYVGAGNRVATVGLEDLAVKRNWDMPGRINGLQIAEKSGRLYVGLKDEIGVIDLNAGTILEPVDPPGVQRIRKLGPVTPGLDPAREEFTCAC